MKKLIILCILLLTALVCATACGNNEENTDGDTSSTELTVSDTEKSEDDKPEPAKQIEQDIVKDGKALYRVVVADGVDERTRTTIQNFIMDFYNKSKVQLPIVRDSSEVDGDLKEIIIGGTTREDSIAVEHDNYFDYGYKFLDNGNVVIYGYGEHGLGKMLSTIINGSVKDGKTTTYKGYNKVESSYESDYAVVPKADFGYVESLYISTNGAHQVTLAKVKESNFADYKSTLESAGFTKHSEIAYDNSNKFATYKNDKLAVHISWHGKLETFEIVVEELGYLPSATAPSYTKKVDATLTQMKLATGHGMQYVIQLEDGSFIIIDGGVNDATESKALMDFLIEKNQGTGNAKPQVTWMFTHAHPDHIALASNFINANKAKFDLNLVVCNLIEENGIYGSSSFDDNSPDNKKKLYNAIDSAFPKAEIMYCHAGQTLYLPSIRIDTLYTHENVYPAKITTVNSTSTIWKFTFSNGQKFLVLGDTTEHNAQTFLETYETSTIDSDILQAAHHGLNASSGIKYVPQIYTSASPKIVMWATADKDRIANSQFIVSNGVLLNNKNITHYYADVNNTVVFTK